MWKWGEGSVRRMRRDEGSLQPRLRVRLRKGAIVPTVSSDELRLDSAVRSMPMTQVTLDDWAAMPRNRAEVRRGVLVAVPSLGTRHQLAVTRLAYFLDERFPDLVALAGVELLLAEEPLTIRVPDVLVTSSTELNVRRASPPDVRLVIEVLSEGTVRTDRVTKFSEYAEVGIEHYWIVDLEEPASMTTYRLIDGEYENFGEHTGKVSLDFDGTPLTLDLDALITRHAQRP